MKSLLFTDKSPFPSPPGCQPGRMVATRTLAKDGRLYTIVVRDKITVEDPYVVSVKAGAFALQQGERQSATPTERNVRDFLVKQNVVI